ncbi:MAG: oligosaccharide flippase family protein [Bacteroidales bacterium]|nr:oligosaccharide flippase family protein [Bacteroidales bacterium]
MSQLKAGAVLNYVIIVLNTIVGLAYTPYMLRCLGQNEYGLYSLVASVIGYLTILDFGFANAIIRYTAKYRAEGKKREQWELFGMFLIVYLVIGFLAFCGGLALYFNVDMLFDRTMSASDLSQARIMMLLLTVNLVFTFPLSVFTAIVTAYERFVFPRVISILRILLTTAVMIVLLAYGFKAVALVVVTTIFNLSTLFLNYVYCKKKLRIKIKFTGIDWGILKEISKYSFWIFLNAIMDKIYWSTGQFVLGTISGTVAVAIFSVAILLEQMYMQFSISIASVLLPRLTSMVALKASYKEISDIFIRTGRLQCYVMAFILAGFIIFGKGFIFIWAGADYSESYIITLIFFVALFVPLIQNTGISILQARNQLAFRATLYVIIAFISLGCQIWWAHTWGAIGCAAAIGGALVVGTGIVMNIYYYTHQHIDIPKFWREMTGILLVTLLFTIAGVWSCRWFDYRHVPTLIGGIAVFSLTYMPVLWFTCMNDYERGLIKAPLKKILRRL